VPHGGFVHPHSVAVVRGREFRDPEVVRRFATVWPESAGRREAESVWRSLDDQSSAPDPPPPPLPGRSALGSFDPGRRGVRALAVVAVLVLLAAAYFAWRSRPHAEPVPVASSASSVAPAPSGLIVVAVQGRVARPGLYRLPSGSRVADALDAAGGALPGVDLSYVNLARKVSDGELILIGVTAPSDQPGTPGGKVNLNTATLAELDTLPGVGPALAQRILDYRAQHGFHSIDDLRHVPGIGDAKFAQLKDLVTV
jgi:competence protein ComEA